MKFLADENIARSVVKALRQANFDVVDVKEQKWFSKPDAGHIEFAKKNGRVIITHDKDFLIQTVVPVILLRFHDQKPSNVKSRLLSFLASEESKKVQNSTQVMLKEDLVEFHRLG